MKLFFTRNMLTGQIQLCLKEQGQHYASAALRMAYFEHIPYKVVLKHSLTPP